MTNPVAIKSIISEKPICQTNSVTPIEFAAFSASKLGRLPIVIIKSIIHNYSAPGMLARVSRTCKLFNKIACEDKPWKAAALRILNLEIPIDCKNAKAFLIKVLRDHNACCLRFFRSPYFLDLVAHGTIGIGQFTIPMGDMAAAYRDDIVNRFNGSKDPFVQRNRMQAAFNGNSKCHADCKTPQQKYKIACVSAVNQISRTFAQITTPVKSDQLKLSITEDEFMQRFFFHICIPREHFSTSGHFKEIEEVSDPCLCILHNLAKDNISIVHRILQENNPHLWLGPLALTLKNNTNIPHAEKQKILLDYLIGLLSRNWESGFIPNVTEKNPLRKPILAHAKIIIDGLDNENCMFAMQKLIKKQFTLLSQLVVQGNGATIDSSFIFQNISFLNEIKSYICLRFKNPNSNAIESAKTTSAQEISKKEASCSPDVAYFQSVSIEWDLFLFNLNSRILEVFSQPLPFKQGYFQKTFQTSFLLLDGVLDAFREDCLIGNKIVLLENLINEIVLRKLFSKANQKYFLADIITVMPASSSPFKFIKLICEKAKLCYQHWNPLAMIYEMMQAEPDFFLTKAAGMLLETILKFCTDIQKDLFIIQLNNLHSKSEGSLLLAIDNVKKCLEENSKSCAVS